MGWLGDMVKEIPLIKQPLLEINKCNQSIEQWTQHPELLHPGLGSQNIFQMSTPTPVNDMVMALPKINLPDTHFGFEWSDIIFAALVAGTVWYAIKKKKGGGKKKHDLLMGFLWLGWFVSCAVRIGLIMIGFLF